jgi:hypothetical protein
VSRGPGRWQREILATLERYQAFFPNDLLGLEPTRAEQAALHRAVGTLQATRQIAVARWLGRHHSGGKLVIFRYGTLAPPPDQIARIEHSINT